MSFKDLTNKETALDKAKPGKDTAKTPEKPKPKA